ncbi:MAG: alpha/beta hydrolase [Nannocystaceae bacterium]|nr:alpha/beta hydrolase [Nannocystaceae bacterium]
MKDPMPSIHEPLKLHHEVHVCTTPNTGAAAQRVLLLHGLGSSSADWEDQLPALTPTFDVVTCDLRGHGRSRAQPCAETSIAEMAEDVAGLLRTLSLRDGRAPTPTHIVGLSMGGMVGLQLALDAPELARSLVLVNATAQARPRTLRQRLLVWQRKALVRVLGMRVLAKVLAARLFPKPEQALHRARLRRRWPENDTRAYLGAVDAITRWSVTSRLEEVACEVLLVAGDRDYTPVATKHALAATLPSARVCVIPDSGHATPIDQATAFNTELLQFLTGRGRGPCLTEPRGETMNPAAHGARQAPTDR